MGWQMGRAQNPVGRLALTGKALASSTSFEIHSLATGTGLEKPMESPEDDVPRYCQLEGVAPKGNAGGSCLKPCLSFLFNQSSTTYLPHSRSASTP